MEKQINLTCKRAERKYELVDWNEFIYVKGYEVYNGDTPVCFISKDDTIENWGATTFDDYENCEGLIWGDTKKELLANISLENTWWDEDLSVSDIETVIEYFKTLKQLIKLERKVNKLAIFG